MKAALLTRREALTAFNLSAAGLALGIFPKVSAAMGAAKAFDPNVFVHIDPSGDVTLVCARSEMGQGVRSSIPVLIADELGVDPARVRVVQADGDKKYGDQNTDGSSSIRKPFEALRLAGATARAMLVTAAATKWKVDAAACDARDGKVFHTKSARSLGFGELVEAAAKLPVPAHAPLRAFEQLTHVNAQDLPVLDGPAIANGTAVFGADVTLPGMLVAVIARPKVVGGTVKHFDPARALAVPGVLHVVEMPPPVAPYKYQPWGGLAIVAKNTWAAMKGRAALDVTWDTGPHGSYDSAAFREQLLKSVRGEGTALRRVGDVDAALKSAAKIVEAEYHVPHLAHLPMEPPCAVAQVQGGKCEVWASTQNPQIARAEAAHITGLDEKDVTAHVTLLGGGFGRKSKGDFVAEAAFLAQKLAVPVRVQWTREDDVQHDYYNTVNAQMLRAGLDDKGKVIGWLHRTAFPPIGTTFVTPGPDRPTANDLQQGVLDLALDVPNIRAESCPAAPHARIGWFRSVYNIFHAFGVGSFVDELAHATGKDSREMWLELIGVPRVLSLSDLGIAALSNYGEPLEKHPVDAGRLRNVVERVTKACDWPARGKRAFGLAAHRSFVTYTAVVVSVVPDARNGVRVDEAWISMDAGTVVNRDRVHAQMQGAVIMGLSNALFGAITMKDGAVQQSNFFDARIVRFPEAPKKIHIDIVPSDKPPGGVGEPGVPPVGAALANAAFALTGKRVREFPLVKGLRGAS